jgi:hypothetical protein
VGLGPGTPAEAPLALAPVIDAEFADVGACNAETSGGRRLTFVNDSLHHLP